MKKILYNIIKYITLYLKSQYRSNLDKKRILMEDEFTYIPKSIISKVSSLLTFIEIIFMIIIPISFIFPPVKYKYIFLFCVSILFLFKVKEIRLISIRRFFYDIFTKKVLFEFYSICLTTINLIMMLEYKILVIIPIIVVMKYLKIKEVKKVYSYLYSAAFLVLIGVISDNIWIALIDLFVFTLLVLLIRRFANLVLKKRLVKSITLIIYFNLKKIVRKACEEGVVKYLFPYYIFLCGVIYLVINWVINNRIIEVKTEGDIPQILFCVIYFLIYYLNLKKKSLTDDEYFYFATIKLEFKKLNLVYNYIQKILVITCFSIFDIIWGEILLNNVFSLSENIILNIAIIFLLHINIIFISLSASIFVEKCKYEVVKTPQDIKKYMSFVEAIFLFALLVIINMYIIIENNDISEYNNLKNIVKMGEFKKMIFYITSFSSLLGIVKTVNEMWLRKINIERSC